jgi:hypothetical protein
MKYVARGIETTHNLLTARLDITSIRRPVMKIMKVNLQSGVCMTTIATCSALVVKYWLWLAIHLSAMITSGK